METGISRPLGAEPIGPALRKAFRGESSGGTPARLFPAREKRAYEAVVQAMPLDPRSLERCRVVQGMLDLLRASAGSRSAVRATIHPSLGRR